ncbi:MAG: dihydroorotase [Gammaproteobacteria bacterium]|nr:dihydroorotase [Gammaproteobacteria bacterium]
MRQIVLARPDDWHIHLRDGDALATTVPHCARYLGRGLVMPNLQPPVTRVELALAYRDRILRHVPDGSAFTPLMTLYLTDDTPADEVRRAADSEHVMAFKLYPAGATTNSAAGIHGIEALYPIFEVMEREGVVLSIHGEVTDRDCDIFDRERVFIDRHLEEIVKRFPSLRVVLEHITTADAVEFVRAASHHVAATITAHHLVLNRNDMLVGGIRPHHYCLPVPKRERHREALVEAACSGEPRFFFGSDSAPHGRSRKEAACGCAGVYTAHALVEICATAFAHRGALKRLNDFCSGFGADFYGLPRTTETVTLVEEPWTVPEDFPFTGDRLVPFHAGQEMAWRVHDA